MSCDTRCNRTLNQFSDSSISDSLVVVIALFPRRFLARVGTCIFSKPPSRGWQWHVIITPGNASRATASESQGIGRWRSLASRARPPFVLLDKRVFNWRWNQRCDGNTPCAGSVAWMPECLNPASAIRRRIRHRWCVTTAKPGNYPRHATLYIRVYHVDGCTTYVLRVHRALLGSSLRHPACCCCSRWRYVLAAISACVCSRWRATFSALHRCHNGMLEFVRDSYRIRIVTPKNL